MNFGFSIQQLLRGPRDVGRRRCRRMMDSLAPHARFIQSLEDRTLLSAGELDPTFGTNGVVVTNVADQQVWFHAADLAIQPDGKTLLVGTVTNTTNDADFDRPSEYRDRQNWDIFVARVLANGSDIDGDPLDHSFGDNGLVRLNAGPEFDAAGAIEVLPDGRILVAGSTQTGGYNTPWETTVFRLESDGSLDTTFGGGDGIASFPDGPEWVTDMVVQSSGRIVVVGADTDRTTGVISKWWALRRTVRSTAPSPQADKASLTSTAALMTFPRKLSWAQTTVLYWLAEPGHPVTEPELPDTAATED